MRFRKLSSLRRLVLSYLGKNPTTSLLSRLILSRLGKKKIIVFGDSHSAVFSNIADMDVVRVGPATAH